MYGHKLDQVQMSYITNSEAIDSIQIPTRNHMYPIKRHFPILNAGSGPSCKVLIRGQDQLDCSGIRQMVKKSESRRATVKHMRNQSASQPQAQVNQLGYQRVNLP